MITPFGAETTESFREYGFRNGKKYILANADFIEKVALASSLLGITYSDGIARLLGTMPPKFGRGYIL